MGEGIGKVLTYLIFTAIIGFVLSVIFAILLAFNTVKLVESRTKVEPDFRLEANGKRVDTVWVYKFKSE